MESTGKSLVNHWSWAAQKGLMNKNSAGSLRAACTQVLSVLDDWENVDINELDLDDVINRFENLKAQDFRPKTLHEYGNRFRRAVQSFQDYIREPSSWSPTKSNTSSRRSKKESEAGPPKTEDRAGDEKSSIFGTILGTNNFGTNNLVDYPFPLRQDTIAILRLPNDLASDEVERLNTFMKALVVDF